MQFRFFDPGKPTTVTQGHLPHWEQEGATYFITWRTADSIPKAKWQYWHRLRSEWLVHHHIDPTNPDWRRRVEALPDAQRRAFSRFARILEQEVDSCHGTCPLRNPACAGIVESALRHLDGTGYLLGDFVVMPNHVHVLVGALSRESMLKQVTSWKKWSAIQINRLSGRSGRLWQDESFDHLVRDQSAFHRYRRYIGENPEKAKLRQGDYILGQGMGME